MTLCNMVIEGGGKNGIVAADKTTMEYLQVCALLRVAVQCNPPNTPPQLVSCSICPWEAADSVSRWNCSLDTVTRIISDTNPMHFGTIRPPLPQPLSDHFPPPIVHWGCPGLCALQGKTRLTHDPLFSDGNAK